VGNDVEGLVARLAKLQTCTVGDVLDEMGFTDQVVSQQIVPLDRMMKVVGPAYCIRGQNRPGSSLEAAGGQRGKVGYEMYRHMYPGCVVVMDAGGHRIGGPWGENSATSAKARGAVGIVMDGATRDSLELVRMGWPVFSRGATPARVEGRWTQVAYQEPVSLPGQVSHEVVVRPGDLVLADADGVVVVPQDIAEAVIAASEECTVVEESIRVALENGEDREEVYARNDRYAAAKRARASLA
jgi:regulator of RNase E activity RraA